MISHLKHDPEAENRRLRSEAFTLTAERDRARAERDALAARCQAFDELLARSRWLLRDLGMLRDFAPGFAAAVGRFDRGDKGGAT